MLFQAAAIPQGAQWLEVAAISTKRIMICYVLHPHPHLENLENPNNLRVRKSRKQYTILKIQKAFSQIAFSEKQI